MPLHEQTAIRTWSEENLGPKGPRRRKTAGGEDMDAQTPENEKLEGEAFDDGPDATPRPKSKTVEHSRSPSVRSLTGRRPSQSSPKPGEKDRMSVVTPAVPEAVEDDERRKQGEDLVNGSGSEAGSTQADPSKDPSPGASTKPLPNLKPTSDEELDDVSLEAGASKPDHSRSTTLASLGDVSPPPPPPRDSSSSMQGLSGNFQTSFPPPPPPPKQPHAPEKVAPPSRKLTSPFTWLSRGSSTDKKGASSPPPLMTTHERSDTKSSSITLGSTSTEHANGDEHKVSLRDRFKYLRMRDEAGMGSHDEDGEPQLAGGADADGSSTAASVSGVGSPASGEEEHGPLRSPPLPRPGQMPRRKTIDPKLPPGTVSGMSEAPPAGPQAAVDWDLWQKLVDEGPTAVKGTGEGEIKAAIANGIPQTIRGVVWQVLADSKNDELERMYKDLVARGATPQEGSGSNKERESIASSASSVLSLHSNSAGGSDKDSTTQRSGSDSNLPTVNGTSSGDDKMSKMIHEVHTKPFDLAGIQKLEKTIKKDVGARTSYSKFVSAAGLQDGLFGVCKAYALLDDECGYAQGMNFIAMPLLFNMPEEEAFSLMAALMNAPKYRLRTLFAADMAGLHLLLYQFGRALEDLDPQLYCHLHRRGVEPRLYATQWFLTLFAYRFPLQLVLRVYDFVISEGIEMAMVRFAVSLVTKNRDQLLGMREMDKLTSYLKEKLFDVYIDKSPSASSLLESGFFGSAGGADREVYKAEILVADAVAVEVTPELLRGYEVEWLEQTQLEKGREAELESLRNSATTLTAKVKRLESDAQKTDQEHIEMASELVRTKVENQSLKDENETLKGQVMELRKVVETQTEEVEKRMKGDMDSVMQRNSEIFSENRRLEDELAEMEKTLVATKMEHATLNGEHESLKQKWNNIAGMMQPH